VKSANNYLDRRGIGIAMLLITLAFGFANISFGAVIPFNGGFGGDGVIYGEIAQDFARLIESGGDDKRIQRFLPSAIVYYGLGLLDIPRSAPAVVRGFQTLNLLLLLASVWLYDRIAQDCGWRREVRWGGYFGIFFNFANARMSYFYPVMTDTAAFFLGMLVVYSFYLRRLWGIWAAIMAGIFTWPAFPLNILPLVAFAPDALTGESDEGHKARRAGLLLSAAVVILTWASFRYMNADIFGPSRDLFSGHVWFHPWLTLASLVCLALYAFGFGRGIFGFARLTDVPAILKDFRPGRLVVPVILVATQRFVMAALARTSSYSDHMDNTPLKAPSLMFLVNSSFAVGLTRGVARPLGFLVCHLVYFGPLVALAVLYWREFCAAVHRQGVGMTLYVLLYLAFFVPNTESRHLAADFPVFAVLILDGLNRARLPRYFLPVFIALTALCSGFNLFFWRGYWRGIFGFLDVLDPEKRWGFSFAAEFMPLNYGPFLPTKYYIALYLLAAGVGLVLWLQKRADLRRTREEETRT
jgi:hypothetical protein